MDIGLSKLWEMVKDRVAWRAAVHGVTKSRTELRDSTTMKIYHTSSVLFSFSCIISHKLLKVSRCYHKINTKLTSFDYFYKLISTLFMHVLLFVIKTQ